MYQIYVIKNMYLDHTLQLYYVTMPVIYICIQVAPFTDVIMNTGLSLFISLLFAYKYFFINFNNLHLQG